MNQIMTEKTASDMKMVASKLMKLSEAINFTQLLKQSQDARFKVLKGKYPNMADEKIRGQLWKEMHESLANVRRALFELNMYVDAIGAKFAFTGKDIMTFLQNYINDNDVPQMPIR